RQNVHSWFEARIANELVAREQHYRLYLSLHNWVCFYRATCIRKRESDHGNVNRAGSIHRRLTGSWQESKLEYFCVCK
ncbi:hypothetical protein D7Z07_22730, partial [Escherichia coli]|nr:hypothetical protein [Escherichia coli]